MTFARYGLWVAIFSDGKGSIPIHVMAGTIEHAAACARPALSEAGYDPREYALTSLLAVEGGVFAPCADSPDQKKAPEDPKVPEGVIRFPKPN